MFKVRDDVHTAPAVPPMIHQDHRASPPKILVIADYPDTRSLLRKELQAAHYDVIAAESDVEGLNLSAAVHPDLILVDLPILSMDGVQSWKRLNSHSTTRPTPLIFLTSVSRVEEILTGSGLDAVDCVVKPYRLKELRSRIRRALTVRDEQEKRHEEIQQFRNRFVAKVLSELRTPVTVIAGFCSLLEQKLGRLAPSVSGAYLREIIRHVNDLLDLADGLEGVSRTRSAFEKVGLTQVLREAVEKFRRRLDKKGVRLVFKSPTKDRLMLEGSRRDLFLAFGYLLSNAHRFTAAGGTVTIRILPLGHEARIEMACTGSGVPPEPSGRGISDGETGPLGLTIARSIAERHRGELGVENRSGQESRIWMTLPLNPPLV